MNGYDITIIGGGISGLSLAHYCAQAGLRPLVIEKSERVGGALHSHQVPDDSDPFWIELGAHTCYNSYQNLIGVVEDCGITDRLFRREKVRFKVWADGQIKSIPSQISFGELLLSLPRIFIEKKAGKTVEEYYSRILGRRNYSKLFRAVFNAVPSQEASDFPAEILFKRRNRRKDIPRSYTFDRGLQSIVDAVAARQSLTILTGKEVSDIQYADGSYQITANAEIFSSPVLALATSVNAAAKLLEKLYPDVSEQLAKVETATIETVGVIVDKNNLALEPVAGIVPLDNTFYSIVSRDTAPHDRYRGFTFHFKPELVDREGKLKKITQVLGVGESAFIDVIEKNNYLPSLRVGHDKIVAEIDELIADKPLLITGNYLFGIAVEDCVSRSLSEFRRFQEKMGQFK